MEEKVKMLDKNELVVILNALEAQLRWSKNDLFYLIACRDREMDTNGSITKTCTEVEQLGMVIHKVKGML
jgi:hypothetical protein